MPQAPATPGTPTPSALPGPGTPAPAPGPTPSVGQSPGAPLGPATPQPPAAFPPAPQAPDLPHQQVLPQVQRTVPPQQTDGTTSNNPFERLAALVIQHAADQAERLSQNLNQTPPNTRELSSDEVKSMWYYSPTGSVAQADQTFWAVHDQVLQQTGNHTQAEQQALAAAYPYRAKLAQLGVAGVDRQVQLAEQARKAVDGDQAPDSSQVAADHAAHGARVRQSGGYV
jgi:hypothetical protein